MAVEDVNKAEGTAGFDLLVVGGGLGGFGAAIAACEQDRRSGW
jgi:glycerol-3-phosphate dehydrogenase